jgi:hypothetical protein
MLVGAVAIGGAWGSVTQVLAIHGAGWRDLANVAAAWWLLAAAVAAMARTRPLASACGVLTEASAVFAFYEVQHLRFGVPLLRTEVVVWLGVALCGGLVAGLLAHAARRRRVVAALLAVPLLGEPLLLFVRQTHTDVRAAIWAVEVAVGVVLGVLLVVRDGRFRRGARWSGASERSSRAPSIG